VQTDHTAPASHEVATLLPPMEEADYRELVEDIRAHGLIEPIWLHDGQIIDGRHRYWACREAGREPSFRTWKAGGSLVEFVVSLNLHRRHLNSAQKAVLAVDVVPHLEREAEERRRLLISESRQIETAEIFPPSQEEAKTPRPVLVKTSRQSSTRAARVIQGTNEHYVQDAKRMKKTAPAPARPGSSARPHGARVGRTGC